MIFPEIICCLFLDEKKISPNYSYITEIIINYSLSWSWTINVAIYILPLVTVLVF